LHIGCQIEAKAFDRTTITTGVVENSIVRSILY